MQDLKEEIDLNLIDEDLTKVHERIQENLRVLRSFTRLKEEGYSRTDYIDLLEKRFIKVLWILP